MSLPCEEVELALLETVRSEEVLSHLSGCAKCQAFEKDLGDVQTLGAMPELSGAERAKLVGLAPRTLAALRAQQQRGATLRRFGGFAIAASLGALVTGAALHGRTQAHPISAPVAISDSAFDVPLVLVDDGVVADSDDDVEIAWPNPNEGEAP